MADFMYNGVMAELYMSSYTEEEKNNNYTLIVNKDTKVRRNHSLASSPFY